MNGRICGGGLFRPDSFLNTTDGGIVTHLFSTMVLSLAGIFLLSPMAKAGPSQDVEETCSRRFHGCSEKAKSSSTRCKSPHISMGRTWGLELAAGLPTLAGGHRAPAAAWKSGATVWRSARSWLALGAGVSAGTGASEQLDWVSAELVVDFRMFSAASWGARILFSQGIGYGRWDVLGDEQTQWDLLVSGVALMARLNTAFGRLSTGPQLLVHWDRQLPKLRWFCVPWVVSFMFDLLPVD